MTNEPTKDALGDRMKDYESSSPAAGRLMPLLPVCIRIDGRCFSSFTRGLARPFDERLSNLMVDTTAFLVEETNARMGYTQSDEMSLVLESTAYNSQVYFDGRVSKILSVLAALASVFFGKRLAAAIPEKGGRDPVFDCRAWNVPNRTEAVNTLIWREQDATRNSISMSAQSLYSHKQLMGKSCDEKQEMIFQKGVNWNDYPAFFKRGTYVQRQTISRPFTSLEIEQLPPKHEARANPNLTVERRTVARLDLPPLARIANREAVVFDGKRPVIKASELAHMVCPFGDDIDL